MAAGLLRLDTGGAAAILDEPPSKANSVSAANGTTMSSGVSPRSAALLAPATTLGWASRRSIGRWDAKWSSSSSRDERRSGCYIGSMSLPNRELQVVSRAAGAPPRTVPVKSPLAPRQAEACIVYEPDARQDE